MTGLRLHIDLSDVTDRAAAIAAFARGARETRPLLDEIGAHLES